MDLSVDNFPIRTNPQNMVLQFDPSFHTTFDGEIFFNAQLAFDGDSFLYDGGDRLVHPVVGPTGRANQIPRSRNRQRAIGIAISTQYDSTLQGSSNARVGSHCTPLSRCLSLNVTPDAEQESLCWRPTPGHLFFDRLLKRLREADSRVSVRQAT